MYYIGLDVHKRSISYCVKDGGGKIHAEGTIPATRFDLDRWMRSSGVDDIRVDIRPALTLIFHLICGSLRNVATEITFNRV
jgi:hypothetical protein